MRSTNIATLFGKVDLDGGGTESLDIEEGFGGEEVARCTRVQDGTREMIVGGG